MRRSVTERLWPSLKREHNGPPRGSNKAWLGNMFRRQQPPHEQQQSPAADRSTRPRGENTPRFALPRGATACTNSATACGPTAATRHLSSGASPRAPGLETHPCVHLPPRFIARACDAFMTTQYKRPPLPPPPPPTSNYPDKHAHTPSFPKREKNLTVGKSSGGRESTILSARFTHSRICLWMWGEAACAGCNESGRGERTQEEPNVAVQGGDKSEMVGLKGRAVKAKLVPNTQRTSHHSRTTHVRPHLLTSLHGSSLRCTRSTGGRIKRLGKRNQTFSPKLSADLKRPAVVDTQTVASNGSTALEQLVSQKRVLPSRKTHTTTTTAAPGAHKTWHFSCLGTPRA